MNLLPCLYLIISSFVAPEPATSFSKMNTVNSTPAPAAQQQSSTSESSTEETDPQPTVSMQPSGVTS
jgi:hypothetical protein